MVEFIDNSDEVLEELEAAVHRAAERCGNLAEGYAADLAPFDTGNLKNSISHRVAEDADGVAAYIGTNVEYAPYVEFGTGCHSSTGGGTPKDHWVYLGDDGKFHVGVPQPPKPFLKPAVANHIQTYINIAKDELKSG